MFEATFAIAAKFPIPMRGNENKEFRRLRSPYRVFPIPMRGNEKLEERAAAKAFNKGFQSP